MLAPPAAKRIWLIDSGLAGSGTRAEDAQGTPTLSRTSPSILVFEDHIRQPRPDSGRDFQVKVIIHIEVFPIFTRKRWEGGTIIMISILYRERKKEGGGERDSERETNTQWKYRTPSFEEDVLAETLVQSGTLVVCLQRFL